MRREGRTFALRPLLSTRAAMTFITLSSALLAFSYGGLTAGAKKAYLGDEPLIGAAKNTAPARSIPEAMNTGQPPKDVTQQLESAPDIEIQFENSTDAPLIISGARVKAVKTSFVPYPESPRNRYRISPDVTLQNVTDKPVTGLVLRFVCAGNIAAKTYSGEGGLNLMSGDEYRFKMKPPWDTFELDDDPNRLRVSVAAVLLQDELLWVNLDHTGRQPEGGFGTRSDGRYSHPPYSSEVPPSTPATADQSEPRPRVSTAKTVRNALCRGDKCPLISIKGIGELMRDLTVIFEKSAEARIQRAGDYYLVNLRSGDIIEIMLRLNALKYTRTGNHLTVMPDAFPESFHRLILAN